ncbi:unnamed protein product [Lepeophtheirus salmonis]|uniref:(salmon louse) hypothetical protein n=1 Tax=Lepeophtheirus salmonis TaxID=72036 RepID=A0A7R8CNT4_LEPSM|nr:unnamed protein product [Lepeophtheirus salmonis]CAF2878101.1 unnamed protein product [Lepeophtheirus salmonis]
MAKRLPRVKVLLKFLNSSATTTGCYAEGSRGQNLASIVKEQQLEGLHQIDSQFEDLFNAYGTITIEKKKLKEPKSPSSRSKSRKRSVRKFRRPPKETSQKNVTSSRKSTEWIWNSLENDDSSLCLFPRPVFGKVPHFLNTLDAARLLTGLREFKNANVIRVGSSMCLMPLRELVLRKKKLLYSNVRDHLNRDYLYCIKSKDLKSNKDFEIAKTKRGLFIYGKPLKIGLKNSIEKINMFVVGSVAVCRNGVRLGDGKGLVDLDWGMLYDVGVVDNNTIVVTLVTDDQIVRDDLLPSWVRNERDLTVDIIVTPTKVLHVDQKLKKPCCGILPSLLTDEIKETFPSLRIYDSDFTTFIASRGSLKALT